MYLRRPAMDCALIYTVLLQSMYTYRTSSGCVGEAGFIYYCTMLAQRTPARACVRATTIRTTIYSITLTRGTLQTIPPLFNQPPSI